VSEDAAPGKSLKTRALQGVAWTLAGDGGIQVVRVISNLLLTRLLNPEAFGVMVVITLVQQGLVMFSDVGIQPAIVQNKRGDDQVFLDTAWTTQVIRGVMLSLVTWALAWPVAIYSREPSLAHYLPVAGLSSLADGFLSTKVFTSDRHLSLGRLTLLNVGSSAFGLVVRVTWALISPTVWALVWAGLLATILRVILSHWVIPGPVNRFRWERDALRELVHFGRWVFLSTILTFVALQLDKIVFVQLIPLSLLGIYNIGLMLCRLPLETMQKIISNVAFPVFSRLKDSEGNFELAYARVRAPLMVGCGAVLSFLTLAGPLVAQILYSARYHDAGWIMQLVAVGIWFQALGATNVTALLALGLPKWLAAGNLAKICSMAVVLPLSYQRWGFPGALLGMSVVEISKYLVEAYQVRSRGLKGWGVDIGLTAAVLACAAAALGLHVWAPAERGAWIKIALASMVFLAVWLPLGLWARRVSGFLV
jgi:O-antigen/teichoic acid export membrane protein